MHLAGWDNGARLSDSLTKKHQKIILQSVFLLWIHVLQRALKRRWSTQDIFCVFSKCHTLPRLFDCFWWTSARVPLLISQPWKTHTGSFSRVHGVRSFQVSMLAARYPSVREKPESLSSRDSATPECLAALFPLWLCFFFLQVSSFSGNSFTWAESATNCWKSVSRKTASVFSKSFSKWIFYCIKYKTMTSSFGCSF